MVYQKNPAQQTPIASITKLMTAMVVLDAGQSLDESLAVSDDDVDRLRYTGSRLKVGAVLERQEMMLLALMASENRAASALARYYPGGRAAAVRAMNRKAQALGMSQTHYADPTGLDNRNVSTAGDLVKLVKAAARYPLLRHFTTTGEHTVAVGSKGRELTFRNTNLLVRNSDWQINLSKTGFIREAGHCLVMEAEIANRPLVIVLLDSDGRLSRIGDANRIRRWMEGGAGTPTASHGGLPPVSSSGAARPGAPAPG